MGRFLLGCASGEHPNTGRCSCPEPELEAMCKCGHSYGVHTRGTTGPCQGATEHTVEECDCKQWAA